MKLVIVHLASHYNFHAQEGIQKFIQQTEITLPGESRTLWFGRGFRKAPRLEAEVIVSHLPVRWHSFSFFAALRALNPDSRIIHVEHEVGSGNQSTPIPFLPKSIALLRSTYSLFDRVVHETRDLSGDLTLLNT